MYIYIHNYNSKLDADINFVDSQALEIVLTELMSL